MSNNTFLRMRHIKTCFFFFLFIVLRNKLAFTLSQLFLRAFPSHIPTFLHPFFALLSPPTSSPPNLHPQLLTIRLLLEIAQEIHDTTLKTARIMTKERQDRDGVVRDVIRSSGDDKTAVEGMLGIIEKGLEQINRGNNSDKWAEAVDATLKTLSAWIRTSFRLIVVCNIKCLLTFKKFSLDRSRRRSKSHHASFLSPTPPTAHSFLPYGHSRYLPYPRSQGHPRSFLQASSPSCASARSCD